MGDTLHLYEENAAEKIKELAESIDICMFCTHSKNKELSSRPMSTQKVDNNGYIRFMSRKDSNKNRQIEE